MVVAGSRVVTPDQRAVLPWRETLRYKPLQAGYHRGASPAEVVIPLTVHAPSGVEVKGWFPAPLQTPAWWLGLRSVELPEPVADGTLFPVPAPPDRVVEALLASDVYQAQRRRANAHPLPTPRSPQCWAPYRMPGVSVTARHGRRGRRSTGTPVARRRGTPAAVAQCRRLHVLAFDVDGVTLVLDKALLVEEISSAALQSPRCKSPRPKHRCTSLRRCTGASPKTWRPAEYVRSAFRPVLDAWLFTLEEDVLAGGRAGRHGRR